MKQKTKAKILAGLIAAGSLGIVACPGSNTTPQEVAVATVGGVNIYLSGVSAGDAATVIGFINAAYDSWNAMQQSNWAARVTRINIVPGNTATGSGILNIGKDILPPALSPFLSGVVAYLQLENGTRLVIDTTLWNKNQRII